MRYFILLISFLGIYSCNDHYRVKDHIANGNNDYYKRDFENAITDYKKALFLSKTDTIANYNIGNGLYRIKEFEKAADYYKTTDSLSLYSNTRAEAKHNEGNAYIKAQQFDKALDAYKEALRNNPDDEETQYNLNVALEKIKQKEEQEERQKKKEEQQKQQQQEQKKQDQQQNQQGKNDEKKSGEKQKQNQQQKQQQNKKQENEKKQEEQKSKSEKKKEEEKTKDSSSSQPQSSTQNQERGEKADLSISKEQVEAILRALENEEKSVQRRMLDKDRRKQKRTEKLEKDW
ncbi:MAG: tetratricopeptide repeat protein [Flavobacteriales bacterium]